ncbi:MAG: hypothetical protein U1E27_11320 [Kiritimatiellia bacterium]|nr:hypothetical protein [Kiritimatiellia bacterium]
MKKRILGAFFGLLWAATAGASSINGLWAQWRTEDRGSADGYGLKIALTEPGTTSALELRATLFPDVATDTDPAGSPKLKLTPVEIGTRIPVSQDGPLELYIGLGFGYYMLEKGSEPVKDKFGYYGAIGIDFRLGKSVLISAEAIYRRVRSTLSGADLNLDGLGVNLGIGYQW